jgi:hypothetical protein
MENDAANQGAAFLPDWLGGIALLVAVAFGFAWLLRRAGFPGAAAVGGIAAGLVLGPGVLGRIAPEVHDRLFGAAPAEFAAWREAERAVEATQFVAGSAGVDPASARVQVETLVAETEVRRAAWHAAVERARRPFALVAICLAALVFLLGGSVRPSDAEASEGGRRRGILLGAWNACVPAVLAAVALRWLGEPAWSPTMFAAMAAVAAGAWPLEGADRASARQALPGGERIVRTAALLANAVALALFAAAAGLAAPHPLAIPAVVALAAAFALGPALGSFLPDDRLVRTVLAVLVPSLAALAALRVEPFLDFRWSLLVVLALIADDGRWLGGTLGSWLPGGISFDRAMRLGLLAIPASPAMLAIVAVSLATGWLSPAAAAGVLAGVLLIETLAPVRRRFAADLPDR